MSSLTITLHWQSGATVRQANVVCEDSPPQELLPLLLTGCGLPAHDADGRPLPYILRTSRTGRPALHPARSLSAQQVRDGAHLWLAPLDQPAMLAPTGTAHRCLLVFPGEIGEWSVPTRGLALNRTWLLRALELIDPATYQRERELLPQRASPLIYVSSRTHCQISRTSDGEWRIQTDRDDVHTFLNSIALRPALAHPLADGDRLRLGDGGPTFTMVLC